MKKNRMMRLASGLLVAVLLTTSVISGTFAKYTTSASSKDSARVANWGFDNTESIIINDLFKNAYDNENVSSLVDVIAPGTTNSASFKFTYDERNVDAPEVAYTFTVSVDGSICDPTIAANPNIRWRLDDGNWGDWGTLLNSIKALSGDASGSKNYLPGQLPEKFGLNDNLHTVEWQWIFETKDNNDVVDTAQDVTDTTLGNAENLANVELVITINATQLD